MLVVYFHIVLIHYFFLRSIISTSSNEVDHFSKRANGEESTSSSKQQIDPGKRRSQYLISSGLKQLEQYRDHGLTWKGFSNFGVFADEKSKESTPKIEVQNGKKSGHVISWVLQHPNEFRAIDQSKVNQSKRIKEPLGLYSKQHSRPNIHVAGFVEKGILDPKEHDAIKPLIRLTNDGHHVVHVTASKTRSDPNSSSRYPFLHVEPGTQHSRIISAFLNNDKNTKFKKSKHSTGSSNTHSGSLMPTHGQTLNLIDRLGKKPMSTADTEKTLQTNKKPRRSL